MIMRWTEAASKVVREQFTESESWRDKQELAGGEPEGQSPGQREQWMQRPETDQLLLMGQLRAVWESRRVNELGG